MMNNIDHLGQGQIMVFDDVMTNIDNTMSVGSYNNSSGIFTAPSTDVLVTILTVWLEFYFDILITARSCYSKSIKVTTIKKRLL